jgi:hypothetical protein
VHRARVLRRELLAAALDHRQRVHVAAQHHHRPVLGRTAPQYGGDRRQRRSGADLQRKPVERRQHRLLGSRQVQTDLGDLVQFPP